MGDKTWDKFLQKLEELNISEDNAKQMKGEDVKQLINTFNFTIVDKTQILSQCEAKWWSSLIKYKAIEKTQYAGSNDKGCAEGGRFQARFNTPMGLIKVDNYLYVCDSENDRICKIDHKSVSSWINISHPMYIDFYRAQRCFIVSNDSTIFLVSEEGKSQILINGVSNFTQITVDQQTGNVYFVNDHTIRMCTLQGNVSTLVALPQDEEIKMNYSGLCFDNHNRELIVVAADGIIYKVTLNGDIKEISENIGIPNPIIMPNGSIIVNNILHLVSFSLQDEEGMEEPDLFAANICCNVLALDSENNTIYVTEYNSHMIQAIKYKEITIPGIVRNK